jgi:hypothetical protein
VGSVSESGRDTTLWPSSVDPRAREVEQVIHIRREAACETTSMAAVTMPPAELPLKRDPAVEWLVASPEPGIRLQARRDLLGEAPTEDAAQILEGPLVRELLRGQQDDGGFGGHPYHKWAGAHWRLVALVELAIPSGEARAIAALDTVLDWVTGTSHLRNVPIINELPRRCGSQEGNALAVACRLGRFDDPRVELLARSLIGWQWPDGGWNCDRRAAAHHSSFNESLAPMWGLHEFAVSTGDKEAGEAAARTAELLLAHRVFRSHRTGEPIHPSVVEIHWPPYWHYDFLQALLVLARMGFASDPRTDDAVALLQEQQLPEGRWRVTRQWWSWPRRRGSKAAEVVDWTKNDAADQMVTLNALRILAARREAVTVGATARR